MYYDWSYLNVADSKVLEYNDGNHDDDDEADKQTMVVSGYAFIQE